MRRRKLAWRALYCILLGFIFIHSGMAEAAFVDEQQAREVVVNWLRMNDTPMRENMGTAIREVRRYRGGEHGNPGYYVVFLEPTGWVVVPADDRLEAIRAFGKGSPSAKEFDTSVSASLFRVEVTDSMQGNFKMQARRSDAQISASPVFKRWEKLLKSPQGNLFTRATSGVTLSELSDDVVVAPLLKNTWHQRGLISPGRSASLLEEPTFYNHFTSKGDVRYAVGCVPLAAAQIMRYTQFPKNAPVSPDANFKIRIDGVEIEEAVLRQDNGYNWDIMDRSPDYFRYRHILEGTPPDSGDLTFKEATEIRDEIATLLHDVGIYFRASYISAVSDDVVALPLGGSRLVSVDLSETTARTYETPYVLTRFFKYKNAAYMTTLHTDQMTQILNSNLDAKLPVIMTTGLSSREIGHAFVVDGYGYQNYGSSLGKAQYHHFNLGMGVSWAEDLWFNIATPPFILPEALHDDLTLRNNGFGFVFNIMSDDLGGQEREIISGRLWGGKV